MTSCPRERHSRAPQCRLADPGRSLQDQGRGSPRYRPDEGLHLGEFGVSPEDPVNRLFHPTPPPASAPILWANGQRDRSLPGVLGRRVAWLACTAWNKDAKNALL